MKKDAKSIDMSAPVQRSLFNDENGKTRISRSEYDTYIDILNHIDPAKGETKKTFTATELALVLFDTTDTKGVYALVESGELKGSNFGTGDTKRRCKFTRDSIKEFLDKRCLDNW